MTDRSVKILTGQIEDVLIKVGEFIFPMDLIVLKTAPVENPQGQIRVILSRPFRSNALINCHSSLMKLTFGNMMIDLNIFNLRRQLSDPSDQSFEVDLIQRLSSEHFAEDHMDSDFGCTYQSFEKLYEEEIKLFAKMDQQVNHVSSTHREPYPEPMNEEPCSRLHPSMEKPPKLDIKPLSDILMYACLGADEILPVIIAANLSKSKGEALFSVLRENKEAIGWTMADIKGISPTIVQHRIHLTEEANPRRHPQRRLISIMKEAVRKYILKCLDNGTIYPISDSSWVSPI